MVEQTNYRPHIESVAHLLPVTQHSVPHARREYYLQILELTVPGPATVSQTACNHSAAASGLGAARISESPLSTEMIYKVIQNRSEEEVALKFTHKLTCLLVQSHMELLMVWFDKSVICGQTGHSCYRQTDRQAGRRTQTDKQTAT